MHGVDSVPSPSWRKVCQPCSQQSEVDVTLPPSCLRLLVTAPPCPLKQVLPKPSFVLFFIAKCLYQFWPYLANFSISML